MRARDRFFCKCNQFALRTTRISGYILELTKMSVCARSLDHLLLNGKAVVSCNANFLFLQAAINF